MNKYEKEKYTWGQYFIIPFQFQLHLNTVTIYILYRMTKQEDTAKGDWKNHLGRSFLNFETFCPQMSTIFSVSIRCTYHLISKYKFIIKNIRHSAFYIYFHALVFDWGNTVHRSIIKLLNGEKIFYRKI